MMDIVDAVELVLDLAKQNVLAICDIDSHELAVEYVRQRDAIDAVEYFANNYFGNG